MTDDEDLPNDEYINQEWPKWLKPPMPPPPSSEFHIQRLDGTKLLAEIENQLRGIITMPDGTQVEKWDPECNEKGIGMILSCIYTLGLNQNVFLGNISDEDIRNRCRAIWYNLAEIFCLDYERYGIEKHKRKLLIKKIVFTVHSGLSRSEWGKEATEISSATIRQENVNIDQSGQKQKSLLNPLSWFGKK